MNQKKMIQYYIVAIKVLLIILFAYAATSKAVVFKQFLVQLQESPLIPSYLVFAAALFVILGEILICILLLTEKYDQLGLLSGYSLMLFFSIYLLYIVKLAPNIPCACGGILGQMDHSSHLIFNIITTILIMPILIFKKKSGENKFYYESDVVKFKR